MKLTTIIKKSCYLILYLFVFLYNSSSSFAVDVKDIQNSQKKNSSNIILGNSEFEEVNNQYILDSGDRIFIAFIGLDIFENDYFIDREGYLTLPEIGKYYARGKTIDEILVDLKIKYEEFIYDPDLEITISFYRPVNAYISGEVANPGLYDITLPPLSGKGGSSANRFPKLFDLIRASGGVTNYSDLSKIEVIRNNQNNNGGGKKKATINLLDLIIKGEQDNNIYIYDDDIVYIPKSSEIIPDQIMKVSRSNLNPASINVFVSGDVKGIGPKTIKRGTTLNQAIALSGGKRIFSGKVEFLRFNSEGKVERRIVRYDPLSSSNSYSNPILRDGDIINIRKTPIGVFSDALNEFALPIGATYSLIDLFGEFK